MTLDKPKSPFDLNGTIVLICFNRPDHLKLTIGQLKKAQDFKLFQTIVVQQLGNTEVSSELEKSLPGVKAIQTSYGQDVPVRLRINSNVYQGVSKAFEDPKCDFVVILEDDIFIASDFLWFVRFVIWKMSGDRNFRAVNGFSRMPRDPFRKNFTQGYVRLNFGAGWGWGFDRETFMKLKSVWFGDENDHWDGLIEDFLRTGFVVNPLTSRVINLGLEGSGLHSGVNIKLDNDMINSFEGNSVQSFYRPFHEKNTPFVWRKDCFNLSSRPKYIADFQFIIWKIVFKAKYINVKASRYRGGVSNRLLKAFYSIISRFARKIGEKLFRNNHSEFPSKV